MLENTCELCEELATKDNHHARYHNPRHGDNLRLCEDCNDQCGPYEFLWWYEDEWNANDLVYTASND